MIRDRCIAPVPMTILHVRSTLTGEKEAQVFQDSTSFTRSQDGWFGHWSGGYGDASGSDKLGLKIGFTIL